MDAIKKKMVKLTTETDEATRRADKFDAIAMQAARQIDSKEDRQIEVDRYIARQIGRQLGLQVDRYMVKLIARIARRVDRQIDSKENGQIEVDRYTDRQIDRQKGGKRDRQTEEDRQTGAQIDIQ